jgi:putative SOS response-associated peptidase YedK
VPFSAKDIKVCFANINAKAEGIEGKPALREAFQRPRSLVPVGVLYERKKTGTGKQLGEDFESARWPRSLRNRVGSDQPSAERQRSSSFTRISTLIIAADKPNYSQ